MRHPYLLPRLYPLFHILLCVIAFIPLLHAGTETSLRTFDIPGDSAEQSLQRFSDQSGRGVLFVSSLVQGIRTNPVQGKFTPAEALDRLVRGTGLIATFDEKSGAFGVRKADDPNAKRVAQAPATTPSRSPKVEGDNNGVIKLDTFEVMGSKLLNMDIKRSRDDAQPYVVLDHASISNSGAPNIEAFLKERLTMNTEASLGTQIANSTQGNQSRINLRGLGIAQTLILVDGHRTVGLGTNNGVTQPDLNWIPTAAIERIEVLPTTASGIYGGSATGGVINVILKQDYEGLALDATYDNTFNTDTASRQVDVTAGVSLEQGKTHLLVMASYKRTNALAVGDRDFEQRGIARVFANNPGFYLNSLTPPLGATGNIRSSTGSNLTLKSGAALNSPITFVPAGYSGPSADGGTALVANAGKYNLALANTAQFDTALNPFIEGNQLGQFSGTTMDALGVTIRRQFTPNFQAFAEIMTSSNLNRSPIGVSSSTTYALPASAVTNPFNQAVSVTMPVSAGASSFLVRSSDSRLIGGAILKLPKQWTAEADYTWETSGNAFYSNRTISSAANAAIGNGSIDILGNPSVFQSSLAPYLQAPTAVSPPFWSTLEDASLRFAGPTLQLPGGRLSVSAALEHRFESLSSSFEYIQPIVLFFPARSQSVDSGYIEVKIPLLSEANSVPGVRLLEIQAAGRKDAYTVDGSTGAITVGSRAPLVRVTNKTNSANPTLGLRYQPIPDLILRGSYGTGFLPPNTNQLVPIPLTVASTVIDGHRGGEIATIPIGQLLGQGNPGLQPEKSRSWSTGIIFTPHYIDGLRVSIDYTNIAKRDNIATITPQQIVDNEAILPGRVTRGPVSAGDPFQVGPIIAIDDTLANLAKASVEAYDASIDYHFRAFGRANVQFYAAGTLVEHYTTQLTPGSAVLENVGITSSNPLKFKGNAGVNLTLGNWTLGWFARYFDSYEVANPIITGASVTFLNAGAVRVPSQTYFDTFLGYRFGRVESGSKGALNSWWRHVLAGETELQIGVRNIFNTEPPFDAGTTNLYSAYGDPRLASYWISIRHKL